MSNQEERQKALRVQTGTTETLTGDWHALFTLIGATSGTSYNERLLAWINDQLGTSYSNLPGAMWAYADNQGFDRWSDMGAGVNFADAGGGGGTAGQAIGLLLALTKAS